MIDFDKIDKVIHEKGRLSIMTLLVSQIGKWTFRDIKSHLKMSDGNLISHIRALEKNCYIESFKKKGIGRPQTVYFISKVGKKAFLNYLKILQKLVKMNKK